MCRCGLQGRIFSFLNALNTLACWGPPQLDADPEVVGQVP